MAIEYAAPIVILAGGAAERFGSNKALAELGGKPLVAHVIERLRSQTSAAMAINTNSDQDFAHFRGPKIGDGAQRGLGPLAGILAALHWSKNAGADYVVTTAVDVPFIPLDFVKRLIEAGAPSIAMSDGRWHPLNGLWKCSQIDALEEYLRSGRRSAHGWAERCEASIAEFEVSAEGNDPFWNINTPTDLDRIASRLR